MYSPINLQPHTVNRSQFIGRPESVIVPLILIKSVPDLHQSVSEPEKQEVASGQSCVQ